MGFLGGAPLSTPRGELETASERFQPTFGLAAEAAFDESRSLFGLKPLQDLSEIAKLRGHEGTEIWGVNAGAFDLMRDKEIDGSPTSMVLDPEEANERFGIEDHLKFTVPISENEAAFKRKRKLEEMDRNYILRQNKGFMRNLGTFGIEFVADITDPIGLSTILFPVTSFKTVVKLTQKAGKFMPYGVGMGEAAVGVIVPLTPGYFASQEFQYDFTPGDYGISLAGGIAIGGVIRRLLYMRDTKGLLNQTKAEEDNLKATLDAIDHNQKDIGEQIDDIKVDRAAEQDPKTNAATREQTTIKMVEGKLDTEWHAAYTSMADDNLLLGRPPIHVSIQKLTENIEHLRKNKEVLEKLLETIPEGIHKTNVKRILKQTERYISLNKKQRTKLTKQSKKGKGKKDKKEKTLKVSKEEPEKTGVTSQDVETLETEVKRIMRVLDDAAAKGATTTLSRKNREGLAKKIRELLGEDADKFLDNKKLKNAYNLLKGTIEKTGYLTVENIVNTLKREGIDPEKARIFLQQNENWLNKTRNEQTSSGDLAALDYQNDVDLTPEQRRLHDVEPDYNNDTEFGHRDYSDESELSGAADSEHESVADLFEILERNSFDEETGRGIYDKEKIENIKKRWQSGELDEMDTENALHEYVRCTEG